MSNTTHATLAISMAGVPYQVHRYDYAPGEERVGLQAATALGISPSILLKTLMTKVDGKPVCVVVPSDREISMKALAAAMGGRNAEMMKPKDAERVTGYVVGGISPFAQKKPCPVILEEDALFADRVYINAGQRGLILSIEPEAARAFLEARTAAISS